MSCEAAVWKVAPCQQSPGRPDQAGALVMFAPASKTQPAARPLAVGAVDFIIEAFPSISAATSLPNTTARVRLIASVDNGGVVAATVGGVTLAGGLLSPAIAQYTLVPPAANVATTVLINGATVALRGPVALAAGAGPGRSGMRVVAIGRRGGGLRWQSSLVEQDRRDQGVVLESIKRRLAPLGLVAEHPAEPTLLRLANVQHLYTQVRAVLPEGRRLLEVLRVLFPTPAVGGSPRAAAMGRIRELEGFSRGLYGGTVGWLNARGGGEFLVGIRSGLVRGERAVVYAGAGIVAGSTPEREFAETELKFRALRDAFVHPAAP